MGRTQNIVVPTLPTEYYFKEYGYGSNTIAWAITIYRRRKPDTCTPEELKIFFFKLMNAFPEIISYKYTFEVKTKSPVIHLHALLFMRRGGIQEGKFKDVGGVRFRWVPHDKFYWIHKFQLPTQYDVQRWLKYIKKDNHSIESVKREHTQRRFETKFMFIGLKK